MTLDFNGMFDAQTIAILHGIRRRTTANLDAVAVSERELADFETRCQTEDAAILAPASTGERLRIDAAVSRIRRQPRTEAVTHTDPYALIRRTRDVAPETQIATQHQSKLPLIFTGNSTSFHCCMSSVGGTTVLDDVCA